MIFELIGALALFLVAGYGFYFYLTKKRENKIKEITIKKFKQYGVIAKEEKKILFETKDEIKELLFFHLPARAELTINSATIWEVQRFKTSQLFDQGSFLSSKYSKIVIVYPATEVVKRYLNENELVFVKPNDRFYDLQILPISQIDEFLTTYRKG